MIIPFARVDCSGNEQDYVTDVLRSGWLTTGTKAKQLEDIFAEHIGCQYALSVNSCTAGLHLALEAVGVKAGDQVFVPSMTFTASAETIRYLGAHPVILDVDYKSGALTGEILLEAIKRHPQVKTLVAVHYGGQALPMTQEDGQGILDICQKHGLRLIEDAAHALPAKWNGELVGNFGDITCFSFYANKTMTTGEGGMVTTNNPIYAERMRLMRLHGINRDAWDRYRSINTTWEYDVVAPGFKYNLADLNAAVGLAQFERLDEMRDARQLCAEVYLDRLSTLDHVELPQVQGPMDSHAWHLFPIRIKPESLLDRQQVIDELCSREIGVSVHYKPLHQLSYYRNTYNLDSSAFPNAEAIWQGNLSLPLYNTLTNDELNYICDSLLHLAWKPESDKFYSATRKSLAHSA